MEAIILEDSPLIQRAMRCGLPQEIPCEIVGTNAALREKLAQTGPDIFFLDDEVPEQQGGPTDFHFIANAQEVLRVRPDAQIFYMGSAPNAATQKFCTRHKIRMIHKTEIVSVLAQIDNS